jgi:hypothetical protein
MTAAGRRVDQGENYAASIAVPILCRRVAPDSLERDRADHFEPQAKIQIEGATVSRSHMEPGHEPITTMISHQLPDQAPQPDPGHDVQDGCRHR